MWDQFQKLVVSLFISRKKFESPFGTTYLSLATTNSDREIVISESNTGFDVRTETSEYLKCHESSMVSFFRLFFGGLLLTRFGRRI